MQSAPALTLDDRTRHAAHLALHAPSRRVRRLGPFVGPAVVASVAYIDPGNFATNLQAGPTLGYSLLWVVLLSSMMAMLIQTLSAKLGIATGQNLPELIRAHWPRPVVWFYWVQAEAVAIMTDLAEFLGAALGFHLLCGLPLSASVLLTLIVVLLILGLERRGFRPLEIAIGALVGVIGVAYGLELALSPVHWAEAVHGTFIPHLGAGENGLYLAVGILGATVMPHVIYLHSSLTQRRIVVSDVVKPRLMAATRREVVLAMGLAGLLNMAMLAAAAATFHGQGRPEDMADLSHAWQALTPLLGPAASALFAVALLSSGLSSSVVGTLSGQVVMQGFVRFSIPVWLRRMLTSLPAIVVIYFGIDPTRALVFSQVVLSFGIPFALVPLLVFTSRKDLMGTLANSPRVKVVGWLCATVIVVLNLWLLSQWI